ncbi:hypothetical protein, partial [Neisseria meningitidis]|uniref:hypothetical protein n=1 Tax=Neisseria meningitidis TaxID=487 RepID=UPI001C87E7D9
RIVLFELRRGNAVLVFVNPLYCRLILWVSKPGGVETLPKCRLKIKRQHNNAPNKCKNAV